MLCLCWECDRCVFCLNCEVWSCRCSCMESVSVSPCKCFFPVNICHWPMQTIYRAVRKQKHKMHTFKREESESVW